MFEKPGLVRDDHLPVDLKVEEYWYNSDVIKIKGESDDDVLFDESGQRYSDRADG